tara:strand:- start:2158 stop:3228 length:1071 start_codon:yes stop_codon:yes gene_type:complete
MNPGPEEEDVTPDETPNKPHIVASEGYPGSKDIVDPGLVQEINPEVVAGISRVFDDSNEGKDKEVFFIGPGEENIVFEGMEETHDIPLIVGPPQTGVGGTFRDPFAISKIHNYLEDGGKDRPLNHRVRMPSGEDLPGPYIEVNYVKVNGLFRNVEKSRIFKTGIEMLCHTENVNDFFFPFKLGVNTVALSETGYKVERYLDEVLRVQRSREAFADVDGSYSLQITGGPTIIVRMGTQGNSPSADKFDTVIIGYGSDSREVYHINNLGNVDICETQLNHERSLLVLNALRPFFMVENEFGAKKPRDIAYTGLLASFGQEPVDFSTYLTQKKPVDPTNQIRGGNVHSTGYRNDVGDKK